MLHHKCVVNTVVVSFDRCVVCEKQATGYMAVGRKILQLIDVLAERILDFL